MRVTCLLFLLQGSILLGHAASQVFPLKEVQPGLQGKCRTVFSGTKIESFDFEVVGVSRNLIGPGRDIIWCRMKNDPTGQNVVAQGMSGSPCFIGERNMGALAYSMAFSKEPLFGVQPLESMLEVLEFQENSRSSETGARTTVSQREIPHPTRLAEAPGLASMISKSSHNMVPQMLPLPLEVSGINPALSEQIFKTIKDAGFYPQAGPGGGFSKAADAAELEPGAAVSAIIAQGDIEMAATGTLTWTDGKRFLAFGHPLLGIGATAIPFGKAEVVGVASSYYISSKLSNKGTPIGTLNQDRLCAIGGVIGPVPKFVPMSVTIRRGKATHTYNLEFWDSKFSTLMVYRTALLQFFSNVLESSEEATLRIRSDISLEGLPPLHFEDIFSGESFSWMSSAVIPVRQLAPLYENDFATPALRKITVEAEVLPKAQLAMMDELTVTPREASPGETIRIRAGFQNWHSKRVFQEYEVKLPEEVKGGEVELTLADAGRADQILGFANSDQEPGQGRGLRPRNMEQLITLLNERHQSDHLYLLLTKKSDGLVLQNQRLSALPQSVRRLAANDPASDRPAFLTQSLLSKTDINFGGLVEGSRSIRIKIK